MGHEQTNRRQSVLGLLICIEQTLEHCEISSVKRENRDLVGASISSARDGTGGISATLAQRQALN
jgi:hypothetical protein